MLDIISDQVRRRPGKLGGTGTPFASPSKSPSGAQQAVCQQSVLSQAWSQLGQAWVQEAEWINHDQLAMRASWKVVRMPPLVAQHVCDKLTYLPRSRQVRALISLWTPVAE